MHRRVHARRARTLIERPISRRPPCPSSRSINVASSPSILFVESRARASGTRGTMISSLVLRRRSALEVRHDIIVRSRYHSFIHSVCWIVSRSIDACTLDALAELRTVSYRVPKELNDTIPLKYEPEYVRAIMIIRDYEHLLFLDDDGFREEEFIRSLGGDDGNDGSLLMAVCACDAIGMCCTRRRSRLIGELERQPSSMYVALSNVPHPHMRIERERDCRVYM